MHIQVDHNWSQHQGGIDPLTSQNTLPTNRDSQLHLSGSLAFNLYYAALNINMNQLTHITGSIGMPQVYCEDCCHQL